ncbi:MAG: hypothetical protein WAO78_04010 [Roseovarius sp.]
MNPKEVVKDYLLDTQLAEKQQLATLLGLSEITSEDVENSEERVEQVDNAMPMVLFFSTHLATSVMEYYQTVSPWDAPIEDAERQRIEVWLIKILTANTMGILSQFVGLKLLEVRR